MARKSPNGIGQTEAGNWISNANTLTFFEDIMSEVSASRLVFAVGAWMYCDIVATFFLVAGELSSTYEDRMSCMGRLLP